MSNVRRHAHTLMQSADKANNAIGALFLSIFGAVWLVGWYFNTPGVSPAVLIAIALVAVILSVFAVRLFIHNRLAYAVFRKTADGKRSSMALGIINTAQWVFIFALAALLPQSQAHWFLPAVILVVGAHFVPLASAISYRPYYLTAVALFTVAGLHVWLASNTSLSAIGALGAGLTLWLTALGQMLSKLPLPAKQAS